VLRNVDDARVVDVGGINEREEVIVERQNCLPPLRGVLEVLPVGRPEGPLLHRGGKYMNADELPQQIFAV
jgi:hypothetical protein